MPDTFNILLLGLRASGKTTIGRLLAARLSRPFIDLDDLTAAELSEQSAGAALATHGEPRFRKAESVCLARVLKASGQLIALGGGTPINAASRQLIEARRAAGTVLTVYLDTAPDKLKGRLTADPTLRPSLTGRGTVDEVDDLHFRRDPVYRALADHIIDTGDDTPANLANHLARLVQSKHPNT